MLEVKLPPVERLGRPSAGGRWWLRRIVRPLMRLMFRPSLHGLAHLPADGPFLLVSNHNAGLGLGELMSFACCWTDHFHEGRPLAGFAHSVAFHIWPASAVLPALGAIPSTYASAYHALENGVPILIFPGGDHETFRPVWQANLVDFGGRKGFLRIARETRLPIVPMGIRGSHYTAPILWRSKLLSKALVLPSLLGIKRWALSALSVFGCVAIALTGWAWWVKLLACYAWLVNPLVFLPWVPWTITMRIGPPLSPEVLFGEGDEALGPALERVQAAILAQMS